MVIGFHSYQRRLCTLRREDLSGQGSGSELIYSTLLKGLSGDKEKHASGRRTDGTSRRKGELNVCFA